MNFTNQTDDPPAPEEGKIVIFSKDNKVYIKDSDDGVKQIGANQSLNVEDDVAFNGLSIDGLEPLLPLKTNGNKEKYESNNEIWITENYQFWRQN